MHVLLTIYEIALANIYTEYLIIGMSPCIAKIELQVEQKLPTLPEDINTSIPPSRFIVEIVLFMLSNCMSARFQFRHMMSITISA